MSDRDQDNQNNAPIDEIIVTGVKHDTPDVKGLARDAAGKAISYAIDPVGTGKGLIQDGLIKARMGDINEQTASAAIAMTKEASVGGALTNIAVNRGMYKIADVISNGAGMAIGGALGAANFHEDHKAAIKAMAEKGVPGYQYLEGDFNGDGKMDQVYVDATSLLQDPEAKPTYYTEDNRPDRKHVGPRSKGRMRTVPDASEVIDKAKALSNKAASDALGFAQQAEAEGKDPQKLIMAEIKKPADTGAPDIAVATAPDVTQDVTPITIAPT